MIPPPVTDLCLFVCASVDIPAYRHRIRFVQLRLHRQWHAAVKRKLKAAI